MHSLTGYVLPNLQPHEHRRNKSSQIFEAYSIFSVAKNYESFYLDDGIYNH